jgi:hypothetical protein
MVAVACWRKQQPHEHPHEIAVLVPSMLDTPQIIRPETPGAVTLCPFPHYWRWKSDPQVVGHQSIRTCTC